MKNKIIAILTSILILSGCQSNSSTNSNVNNGEKKYKIGVLQLVQHDALDDVNKGFIKALDDAGLSYDVDQQNAGGEISSVQTIASKFVNDANDLIFAIATPSAQSVAGLTTDIPIVVSAVTDPQSAGIVESNEKPNRNVTGTSDLTPVKEQISLLKKLIPNAKKVGILYSSSEANSVFQVDIAHNALKEEGIEYEDFSVSSLNEIQSVVESMINKIDAIYVPTDNTVASGMSTVSLIATENNLAIIGAEAAHVKNGALATYGINYYELGYLAGKQAVRILKDKENPANMPIEYLSEDKFELSINEEVAKKLNIDISNVK